MFAFVRWGIGLRDDEYHWLNESGQETKPEWSDSLFNSETLDVIRNAFDAGQGLAFRVPMAIQKRGGAVARNTRFDVWIQRDSALDRAEDHFIREDITIPGVSSLKGKGVRAIVVAKDKVLSTFLGDAENPAHTEWQERSPKFKDRYVLGPSCLRFVKNSPREIFDILSKPGKKRESDLLMGIFSIADKKSGPGKEPPPSLPPMPPSAPKLFDIASIAGGFKISENRRWLHFLEISLYQSGL